MSLQFITYTGSAPVDRIGWAPDAPNRVLDLHGTNFVDVVDVLINGTPAPEFLEISPTRVLASVPEAHLGREIVSISVLTGRLQGARAAVIRFHMSSRSLASGSTRMVQTFLYFLLTTPGSDIYAPNDGAGLRRLLARADSDPAMRAIASQAVGIAEGQMVRSQATSTAPDNERLASARLLDLRYDRGTSTTGLRVALTSVAGQDVVAGLRV